MQHKEAIYLPQTERTDIYPPRFTLIHKQETLFGNKYGDEDFPSPPQPYSESTGFKN